MVVANRLLNFFFENQAFLRVSLSPHSRWHPLDPARTQHQVALSAMVSPPEADAALLKTRRREIPHGQGAKVFSHGNPSMASAARGPLTWKTALTTTPLDGVMGGWGLVAGGGGGVSTVVMVVVAVATVVVVVVAQ
jgi:hypothetical protein